MRVYKVVVRFTFSGEDVFADGQSAEGQTILPYQNFRTLAVCTDGDATDAFGLAEASVKKGYADAFAADVARPGSVFRSRNFKAEEFRLVDASLLFDGDVFHQQPPKTPVSSATTETFITSHSGKSTPKTSTTRKMQEVGRVIRKKVKKK